MRQRFYNNIHELGTNVGIGTTSPTAKLQITAGTAVVGGAATYPGDLIIQRGGLGGGSQSLGGLEFNVDSFIDGYGWKIISDDPNNDTNMPLIFSSRFNSASWSDRMAITRQGNVGIGTTSPTATLHLKAGTATASSAPLKLTSGTLLTTAEAGTIEYLSGKFYIRGTEKLSIGSSVQVGADADAASSANVGSMRYRTSGNNSYVDMCMQTGAATYEWINIKQNNW